MTVIIKTGGRSGRDRTATVKQLVALANGNLRHIVSTTGGVEVPDELAFDYLNQFYAVPVSIPEPAPVVEVATLQGVEATPRTDVVAIESIRATDLVEASASSAEDTPQPAPKPKKRKPRKTSATNDEGAE